MTDGSEEISMFKSRLFNDYKQQIYALFGLVIVVIGMSLLSEDFFSTGNALNIGKQASINLVISLGMTVVILSGGIDLSVGSLLGLSIMIAGVLFNVLGYNVYLAFILGILTTVSLGFINGAIIQYGRVPAFITTLGMMGIVRGIVLILAQGHSTMTFPEEILTIADGTFLLLPYPVLISVVMAFLIGGFLKYTSLGRSMYAVGGNEEAARLSGINTALVRTAAYTISGICCAVAGIIFAARVGAPPPSSGVGYELSAIAAVIIGGTSLNGGQGKVVGTVIGALLMAVISNGLTILNVDPYWQSIIIGLIIIFAVMLSSFQKR
jgi:ribose/xylose/arabinose/galactoside ABC-type transport system permease subunit